MLQDDTRANAELTGVVFSILSLSLFLALTVTAGVASFDQAQQAQARDTLKVVGQQLAMTIQDVDRQVRSSASSGPISQTLDISRTVGARQWNVEVVPPDGNGEGELILQTDDGAVTQRVLYASETDVSATTLQGGQLRVIRKSGENEITIEPYATN